MTDLHKLLDWDYFDNGQARLREMIRLGAAINEIVDGEAPLHVATRRRRLDAVEFLLEHGAEIDVQNQFGKTAWVHATRRGFSEVAELLERRGAKTELNAADQLAVAFTNGELERAQKLLDETPESARTGNPEEDRLLADVAGRNASEPVAMLIRAGADLMAPGLDGATALHQAAWFGQPQNAKLLIEAGAPLEIFDPSHNYSPLGWAVHGARYSGGADQRSDVYIKLVKMLLDAGSCLHFPNERCNESYFGKLSDHATPEIQLLLDTAKASRE